MGSNMPYFPKYTVGDAVKSALGRI